MNQLRFRPVQHLKWQPELQFCERYLCNWQKHGPKWSETGNCGRRVGVVTIDCSPFVSSIVVSLDATSSLSVHAGWQTGWYWTVCKWYDTDKTGSYNSCYNLVSCGIYMDAPSWSYSRPCQTAYLKNSTKWK